MQKQKAITGFNKEEGIYYTQTVGDITYQIMLDRMKGIGTLSGTAKNLRILEDATGAQALFSIRELHLLMDHLDEYLAAFKSVKHAVIHSDPTATAYAHIVEQQKHLPKYQLRVFSTREAALFWLKQ